MRKLYVLTFVLILALSGAASAATVSWSGELKAEGTWESGEVAPDEAKLFGRYDMTSSAAVTFTLEDEQETWDASVALKSEFGSAPELGRYILKVNQDALTGTVWGNYGTGNIGHVNDPFVFVRIAGTNEGSAPSVRLKGDFGDFSLTVQVPGSGQQLAVNAATAVRDVSFGATLEHNFKTAPAQDDNFNRVSVYGGFETGVVEFDAAFAVTTLFDEDNSAIGLGASADVTEQLTLSGEYRTVGENFSGHSSGFDLGATYTDGLLRLTADHGVNTDAETSESKLGVIYRGSDDNEPYADLFKDDHYTSNVAFAIGGSYTMSDATNEPASTVALNATGPVLPDAFWFNANFTASRDDDGFQHEDFASVRSYTGLTLDGHALVSDKLTLKPHVASEQWTDVTHGLSTGNAASLTLKIGATYAVAEDVSLRGELGQTRVGGTDDFADPTLNRFSSFGITFKF